MPAENGEICTFQLIHVSIFKIQVNTFPNNSPEEFVNCLQELKNFKNKITLLTLNSRISSSVSPMLGTFSKILDHYSSVKIPQFSPLEQRPLMGRK